MSRPASEDAWRFLAKWFYGSGFAWAVNAERFSSSVRIVTADSAIAALPAAIKPDSINGAVPIADTNGVQKDDSIIVTGSGSTASARRKRA